MKCPYCGGVCADDALYCPNCKQPLPTAQAEDEGRGEGRRERRTPAQRALTAALVVVFAVAVAIGAYIGAILGTKISERVNASAIKRYMSVVFFFICIIMLAKAGGYL